MSKWVILGGVVVVLLALIQVKTGAVRVWYGIDEQQSCVTVTITNRPQQQGVSPPKSCNRPRLRVDVMPIAAIWRSLQAKSD